MLAKLQTQLSNVGGWGGVVFALADFLGVNTTPAANFKIQTGHY